MRIVEEHMIYAEYVKREIEEKFDIFDEEMYTEL